MSRLPPPPRHPPTGRRRPPHLGLRRGLVALALLAAPLTGLQAGTVHRCTDAHGTVSYGQQPCPAHTQAAQVQASDTRSEAQRREAEEVLRRDKALANASTRQNRQARPAQTRAEREGTHREAGNLSGPVRQVSVGARDVDRRGTPAEPLRRNPRQFRAKTPKAPHPATPPTSPTDTGR